MGRATGRRRGCACSTSIFPEGIHDPRLLLRQEHRPPADGEVPHLHDDDRRDEERVRRAARTRSGTTRTRGSTRRSSTCSRSRRRSTPGSSRSWTARRPATARARARCIPVVKNVMLASADQVAIDAVVGEDDGLRPDVARVHPARARGRARRRRSARHRDRRRRRRGAARTGSFHVGDNLVRVGGGDLIWFGPLKRFQKLFFHTPLVNGFILGERGLPRLLPLAARRPPRLRALVRDDRVGPAVPALRADGPAGAAARAGCAASGLDRVH